MRFPIVCLLASLTIGLAASADHPTFAGTWMLDPQQSTGDAPDYAAMTITEKGRFLRMAQNGRDGSVIRTIEGECRMDGRFHPVIGGPGGSISCKWDGSALITDQHWNNDADERSVRTMLDADGKLVQDIHESGAGGAHSAHLVWLRQ